MNEIPDAIVITFPVQFLLDIAENADPALMFADTINANRQPDLFGKNPKILCGYKQLCREIDQMIEDPDGNIWNHSIGVKPRHEVLYAYITVLGKIRWRAKIVDWQEGHEKVFSDGRKRSAKYWLIMADFVKAPTDIPFKGCQGFRYSEKLF